jgi:hypothetical protein
MAPSLRPITWPISDFGVGHLFHEFEDQELLAVGREMPDGS